MNQRLDVKAKTLTFLKEYTGINLHDPGLGNPYETHNTSNKRRRKRFNSTIVKFKTFVHQKHKTKSPYLILQCLIESTSLNSSPITQPTSRSRSAAATMNTWLLVSMPITRLSQGLCPCSPFSLSRNSSSRISKPGSYTSFKSLLTLLS